MRIPSPYGHVPVVLDAAYTTCATLRPAIDAAAIDATINTNVRIFCIAMLSILVYKDIDECHWWVCFRDELTYNILKKVFLSRVKFLNVSFLTDARFLQRLSI